MYSAPEALGAEEAARPRRRLRAGGGLALGPAYTSIIAEGFPSVQSAKGGGKEKRKIFKKGVDKREEI
ncbi:hypothetical protein D7X94_15840 [Acutalibacter sp. 1XD8-33]|nr:hypothetical protein D7X94_15840 [Acutalibacter sp. 1XD8-33]